MPILLLSPVRPRSEFRPLLSISQDAVVTHDRWPGQQTTRSLRELRFDQSAAPVWAATGMSPAQLKDFREPHLRHRWPPARCKPILQGGFGRLLDCVRICQVLHELPPAVRYIEQQVVGVSIL